MMRFLLFCLAWFTGRCYRRLSDDRLPRVLPLDPLFWSEVTVHLADHGIPTRVQGGQLVAYVHRDCFERELFVTEFALFLFGGSPEQQVELLELCWRLEADCEEATGGSNLGEVDSQ